MILREWAAAWGVPWPAVVDLERRLLAGNMADLPHDATSGSPGSEVRQQALVRLDAARHGIWLTRNNVGALQDSRGVPIRYGLANESPQQNEQVKSGDLIGIRSITITTRHVGLVIGQFISREAKHEGWRYTGTPREKAQLNWVHFVVAKGGDAAFCTGPGSF